MRKCDVSDAFGRMLRSLGMGFFLLAVFFTFSGVRHSLGTWEAERWPVLGDVAFCEGSLDAAGRCTGRTVIYESFRQTEATCDGRDALVSGVMSKVRSDATYIDGRQAIYFGDPSGRFRRAFFSFEDQPPGAPSNRPTGVQDWGPWRLVGGCATDYTTWFTTIEHWPIHGLWPLVTQSRTFPLPK